MMISYRHKFIFIHIYKTAGTSIFHALHPYAFHNPLTRLISGLKNRLNLDIIVPFL